MIVPIADPAPTVLFTLYTNCTATCRGVETTAIADIAVTKRTRDINVGNLRDENTNSVKTIGQEIKPDTWEACLYAWLIVYGLWLVASGFTSEVSLLVLGK